MHINSCNNIYSHKLCVFSYFTCVREVTQRKSAIGMCVCIHNKNLNSLKLRKAQVRIHYYLQRIRKINLLTFKRREPTDISFSPSWAHTHFCFQLFWQVNKTLLLPCSPVQDYDIRIWLYLLELYDTYAEKIILTATTTTKKIGFIKLLHYPQVFLLSGLVKTRSGSCCP